MRHLIFFLLLPFLILPFCFAEDVWTLTVNPYADISWSDIHEHEGSFHNHTTQSDGKMDPADVIDAYHALGHEVLALTDHNRSTWPWTAFGRDPKELNMIAIPGNELSTVPHTLSLFSELETDTRDHEKAIQLVEQHDGLSILAHPGRYWELSEGKVPKAVIETYTHLFMTYPTLIGFEVINQDRRYPKDRALWDALLTELMPERPVWGMANDDSHKQKQIGLNTTVLLMTESSEAAVKEALRSGKMYFTSVTTHPQESRDRALTPVIKKIEFTPETQSLRIHSVSGGEPVPEEAYTWISAGGNEVHQGSTLALNEVSGIETYVRAEIRGEGGTSFTQPIGVSKTTP